MATLLRVTGGTTSLLPTTTWAAPNGLAATVDRNDSSAYSWASTTSTVTLPSSGLADGYLLVAAYEFEDTSNGRHNPQGRWTQASGTGSFVGQASSGYNRDTSEDRSYVRCWGFVDNPSASATFQFQWRRDSDAPTGGTVQADVEVIPLYYSNHGIYSSTSTACPGNTTVSQVTGFTSVSQSDTEAIEIASNTVTMKGDNKRYLCLGGSYWQGIGAARTQRIHGFRVDGTADIETFGYSYGRNSANADIGELFTTIVETATTDRTIDQFIYRGDSVTPFPAFGADSAGNATGSNPQHAMVVLELNDSAEVFKSANSGQSNQSITTAGTRVEINATPSAGVEFNDSASFTRADDNGMNVGVAADVLLGANVFAAYTSGSGARCTAYSEFTINGTGQASTISGDYGRGNQGTQDTYAWSANLLSFLAVAANDDVGVSAGKISGGEAGPMTVLGDYVGFWGINLDTLEGGGSTSTSVDASGQGLTASQGSGSVNATQTTDVAAQGQQLATAQGSASVSASQSTSTSASGQQLAASQGSATVSAAGTANVAASGQALSAGQGSATTSVTQNVDTAATGQSLAASQGSATPGATGSTSVAASGQGLTTGQGSASVSVTGAVSVPAAGQGLSANQGTASIFAERSTSVSANGQGLTLSQGTAIALISESTSVAASGQGLSVSQGAISLSVGSSTGGAGTRAFVDTFGNTMS